ncbi:hypothetical protein ACOMHN_004081 [Nucella lapillus]
MPLITYWCGKQEAKGRIPNVGRRLLTSGDLFDFRESVPVQAVKSISARQVLWLFPLLVKFPNVPHAFAIMTKAVSIVLLAAMMTVLLCADGSRAMSLGSFGPMFPSITKSTAPPPKGSYYCLKDVLESLCATCPREYPFCSVDLTSCSWNCSDSQYSTNMLR